MLQGGEVDRTDFWEDSLVLLSFSLHVVWVLLTQRLHAFFSCKLPESQSKTISCALLHMFTTHPQSAAKNYEHKLCITKDNKWRLGLIVDHFLSTNLVLFSNKPSKNTDLPSAHNTRREKAVAQADRPVQSPHFLFPHKQKMGHGGIAKDMGQMESRKAVGATGKW